MHVWSLTIHRYHVYMPPRRLQLTFRLKTWCKWRLLWLNFNVAANGHLDFIMGNILKCFLAKCSMEYGSLVWTAVWSYSQGMVSISRLFNPYKNKTQLKRENGTWKTKGYVPDWSWLWEVACRFCFCMNQTNQTQINLSIHLESCFWQTDCWKSLLLALFWSPLTPEGNV